MRANTCLPRNGAGMAHRQMNLKMWNSNPVGGMKRDMFKVSDRAALKEIRKLLDLKAIKAEGKGRSLIYVMA